MSVQVEKVCVNQELKSKSETPKQHKWDIVWSNVIALSILQILAIYGITIKCQILPASWWFLKAILLYTAMGITAGYHRLWSHNSYKANTPLQILLMVAVSCCYQNSIYTWVRDHRMHHRFCDTDGDPHNSRRGFFFSHCGWLLVRKHKDIVEKGKTMNFSDLESNPIVMFQHKYYYVIVTIFTLLIPMLVPWYFWGESLRNCFAVLVAYKVVLVLHVTWCVNSFAHLFGTRPYNKNIQPTVNVVSLIFNWGEGFHNFHHTFPFDYRSSELGKDISNTTAWFIEFFRWIGWATNLKTVPQSVVDVWVEQNGDGSRTYPRFSFVQKYVPSKHRRLLDNLLYTFVAWFTFYLM